MKRKYLFFGILSIFISLLIVPCSSGQYGSYDTLPKHNRYINYKIDFSSDLIQRVGDAPDFVLDYLKKLDNCDSYANNTPRGPGKKIVRESLDRLPAYLNNTLKKKLLGIYFIDNFTGSGLTDWVVDKDGFVYAFMVFNTKVLDKNVSELLTWKERTSFIDDDQKMKIEIQGGGDMNGFQYILLHESLHVYDYTHLITPYGDGQIKEYFKLSAKSTKFTEGVWCGINIPCNKYPFAGKVTFYGLGKTGLLVSTAEQTYDALSRSPFVSLYGSLSWVEDFAETGAFYHLTEVMKQRYSICVYRQGKLIKKYEPAKFPLVRERFRLIEPLYKAYN